VIDVYIALGTNVGDRAENLRRALEALAPHVAVEKKSSVYESVAMYVDQPRFYNMVVQGNTMLTPHDLLRFLKAIETEMGRKPDTHNEPRVIDLDILLHGQLMLDLPELTIPHPRMHERSFVLTPLAEIAPYLEHPASRQSMIDLEDRLGFTADSIWEAGERV
jgi:2-amino-4-hydroxy-6-hydroxymethyldihydropteridine diphosphokinase